MIIAFYFILFVNLNVATITSIFVQLRIINCYFCSVWVGLVDSTLSRRELQSRVNLFFMPGVLIVGLVISMTSIISRHVMLKSSKIEAGLDTPREFSIMNLNNCS